MTDIHPETSPGATGGPPGDNAAFRTRELAPDELAVLSPGAALDITPDRTDDAYDVAADLDTDLDDDTDLGTVQ